MCTKSTLARKVMALNKFIFRFYFQPDPGGLSLKSRNWAGEKGHPVNFAPKDNGWTTAGVLGHFWGHGPLWEFWSKLQNLSFPRKTKTHICLEFQGIHLWTLTESAHFGHREGDSWKSQRNQKGILKSQWNPRRLWSNSVESYWNA